MPESTTPVSSGSADVIGRSRPYRTLPERVARGLAWRESAPLEAHADYALGRRRKNPVGILRAQDGVRVQDLIPIRYGRMSASPFAFYRGSAAIMAYDLASQHRTPGRTQICGDAHLANFGVFALARARPGLRRQRLRRDPSGPVRVGREAAGRLPGPRCPRPRVPAQGRTDRYHAALVAYRTAISELAGWGPSTSGTRGSTSRRCCGRSPRCASPGLKKGASKAAAKAATANFDAARRKTSMRAAEKLTETVDGQHRFREDPPLLSRSVITDQDRERVFAAFGDYRATLPDDRRRLLERYHLMDVAQKVVGVGSVGTRGRDPALEGARRGRSAGHAVQGGHDVGARAVRGRQPASQHGERVVEGQRYMQAASDIFLGWVRGEGGRDFYVRQLHDMKGSVDTHTIQPIGSTAYAGLCGATLARAHARGGDVVAIDAYIGTDDTFVEALEEFAHALRRPSRTGLRTTPAGHQRRSRTGP